jgi:hypothetical protein
MNLLKTIAIRLKLWKRPRYQVHVSKGTTYSSKGGVLVEIFAYRGSTVYAYANAIVWAADGATVHSYPGSVVHASRQSLILSHGAAA